MKNLFLLSFVSLLVFTASCLQRGPLGQRRAFGSDLSLIKIKIAAENDEQRKLWAKELTEKKVSLSVTDDCAKKYHNVSDDKILSDDVHEIAKDDSAFTFESVDFKWDVYKGCTYYVKMQFGNSKSGSFVAFYRSKEKSEKIVVVGDKEEPRYGLELTPEGQALEAKLKKDIISVDISEIELEINFKTDNHDLTGQFETGCFAEAFAAQATWYAKETLSVSREVVRVVKERYSDALCTEENLQLTEVGVGELMQLAKNTTTSGQPNQFGIWLILRERGIVIENEMPGTFDLWEQFCGVVKPSPGRMSSLDISRAPKVPHCSDQLAFRSIHILDKVQYDGKELYFFEKEYENNRLKGLVSPARVDLKKKFVKK